MTKQTSAITQVPGFRAIGVTAGLKQTGAPDLTLIVADEPCSTAALFTTNQFKAAPVLYDMAVLKRNNNQAQAVIINAGNANAVTGERGLADAAEMARLTESACHLPEDSVLVMSTGIIGHPLPMDKIATAIQTASQTIQTEAGAQGLHAAQAIMTTDLVPKEATRQLTINGTTVHLGGMAKGSGMIEPNMATMLAVVVTDAALEQSLLQAALKQAVEASFNAITVDSDTSTNDTIVLMASGKTTSPIDFTETAYQQFCEGLTDLCIELAKMVARDGEGATKLVEITVNQARTTAEAKQIAKTVANSPLVKTALYGNDPNWGRILAAVGRSGVTVNPHQTSLHLGPYALVAHGEPLDFDAIAAHDWMSDQSDLAITINLGLGKAHSTVWTCDFSYDYVKINAEYHT